MKFIGIDPGAKGGIAVIGEGIAVAYPYDDEMLNSLATLEIKTDCVAIVERVGAMPKQGVVGMFNFGKSYGYILGVLEANHIKTVKVAPQRWKKDIGVTSDKRTSIKKAKELFPGVDLRRTSKCRTDSDGMAEALLIAEWGRRGHRRDAIFEIENEC